MATPEILTIPVHTAHSNGTTPTPMPASVTPISAPVASSRFAAPMPASPAPTLPVADPKPLPALSGDAHRFTDRIVRLRDRVGNRLPWSGAFSTPLIHPDVPLRQTPLAGVVEKIAETLPIPAGTLEHYYDSRLCEEVRRLIAVCDEEEAALHARNTHAHATNEAADAREAHVNREDRARLADIAQDLEDAHQAAGEAVAVADGAYDPKNPLASVCLPAPAPRPLESLAGEKGLPWTPSDKSALPHSVVGWVCTLCVGVMIGASLGILSKLVNAADPMARPEWLGLLLAAGVAAAVCGKYAVRLSAREASQRYWLDRPRPQWLSFGVFSAIVAALLMGMDALVEREGLMAAIRVQRMVSGLGGVSAAHSTGGEEAMFLVMAMILTFGYIVTAWWDGYLHGRYEACMNRLRAAQESGHQAEVSLWKARAEVRAAQNALSHVQTLLARQAEMQARVDTRKAECDAHRLPIVTGLDETAQKRIQDARDQAGGAQQTFDAMLSDARARCENTEGWLLRLRRRLLGTPNPDTGRVRSHK